MIDLTQQLVDLDDATIEIVTGGTGRPTVCTTHPIDADHLESCRWYGQYTHVVGVMPRGVGNSSSIHEARDLTIVQLVHDLEAVRRKLDVGRWVLVGYSGGCTVALTYALTYPDAVGGLIIGFGAATFTGIDVEPRSILSPAHPSYQAELSAAGLHLQAAASVQTPRWIQLRPDLRVLVQGQKPLIMLPAEPSPRLTTYLETIVHFDVRSRLGEIPVPTLVVCGRHDPLVPADACAALHNGIPQSDLLMLEHSGHGVDDADMPLFRETIRRFLTRLTHPSGHPREEARP